jgi:hypothetical protein
MVTGMNASGMRACDFAFGQVHVAYPEPSDAVAGCF